MRFLPFVLVSASALMMALVACSSDDDPAAAPPGTSTPDAGDVDAPTPDDAGLGDETGTLPAPLPAVTAALEAKAAGALPTTVTPGPIAVGGGVAAWRAPPGGGGVLSVTLAEALPGTRTIEITLYDDTATLDADETFQGEPAAGGFALRKARVETYTTATGASGWGTNGDGVVKVTASTATSVSLSFENLGQFARLPATNDTWILSGTVTVSIAAPTDTMGADATLTPSNAQPEPIGGEALNLASAGVALTGPTKLVEQVYPFTGARRAALVADTQGGVARRLFVAFPSGHLPREGQSIALSTFDRVAVTLVEGTSFSGEPTEKVWEADQGTALVQARTATSLVLALQSARMQSESMAAKGLFDLNGTLTIALP